MGVIKGDTRSLDNGSYDRSMSLFMRAWMKWFHLTPIVIPYIIPYITPF